MPLNLASPGIVVREVDLTVGRVDATSGGVGALVAPFEKGPVEVPVLVGNESDLLKNFGEPSTTDKHYEHWICLLYTSPSPRDRQKSRMPSSA